MGEFSDFLGVDYQFMRSFVLEYVFRRNYTMNREATAQAIIDRYTFWPDPADTEAIRNRFIEVCARNFFILFSFGERRNLLNLALNQFQNFFISLPKELLIFFPFFYDRLNVFFGFVYV